MRSNMFANVENKFQFATEEVIINTALSALGDVLENLPDFNNNAKFFVAILGARLGVFGDGEINEKEKMLIDTVFGRIWTGPMEQIYGAVGETISEKDYEMVRMLTQMGNAVAMPFLHYILSFAYIDEVFEDAVAEKLDGLFGMNLMAEFFAGDMEEVPAPRVKLTGLEAEIVEWFQSDDQLRPLREIQAHFPRYPRQEVKAALDCLCQKGILYGGENFVGNMYGLA